MAVERSVTDIASHERLSLNFNKITILIRRYLFKKPFQKYRLRITMITTKFYAAIITAGNHFKSNHMSATLSLP